MKFTHARAADAILRRVNLFAMLASNPNCRIRWDTAPPLDMNPWTVMSQARLYVAAEKFHYESTGSEVGHVRPRISGLPQYDDHGRMR